MSKSVPCGLASAANIGVWELRKEGHTSQVEMGVGARVCRQSGERNKAEGKKGRKEAKRQGRDGEDTKADAVLFFRCIAKKVLELSSV